MSGIEWTDKSWSPIRGCTPLSPACENCWARRMASRLAYGDTYAPQNPFVKREGGPGPYHGFVKDGKWTGRVELIPDQLEKPLHWRKPRKVAVALMGDLFHEALDFHDIAAVFGIMVHAPQHTFQLLTKRPKRMGAFMRWMTELVPPPEAADLEPMKTNPVLGAEIAAGRRGVRFQARNLYQVRLQTNRSPELPPWPLPNVHLGVSVEDQATADERIPLLLQTPAAVRWVSYEPALGPIRLPRPPESCFDHRGAREGRTSICPNCRKSGPPKHPLDWLVIGGESGPGARPCDVEWIRNAVQQCREAGTAAFVKQLGSHWARDLSHDSKGSKMEHWPPDLRVREFPE